MDIESMGKIAEGAGKLFAFGYAGWHYCLARRKKKEKPLAGSEEIDAKKHDVEMLEEAEQDARYMRNAVFSYFELTQEIEQLHREQVILERDRDLWMELANERQQELQELREEAHSARKDMYGLNDQLQRMTNHRDLLQKEKDLLQ